MWALIVIHVSVPAQTHATVPRNAHYWARGGGPSTLGRLRSIPMGSPIGNPRRRRCAQHKIPLPWTPYASYAAVRFARGPIRCAQGDGRCVRCQDTCDRVLRMTVWWWRGMPIVVG